MTNEPRCRHCLHLLALAPPAGTCRPTHCLLPVRLSRMGPTRRL